MLVEGTAFAEISWHGAGITLACLTTSVIFDQEMLNQPEADPLSAALHVIFGSMHKAPHLARPILPLEDRILRWHFLILMMNFMFSSLR